MFLDRSIDVRSTSFYYLVEFAEFVTTHSEKVSRLRRCWMRRELQEIIGSVDPVVSQKRKTIEFEEHTRDELMKEIPSMLVKDIRQDTKSLVGGSSSVETFGEESSVAPERVVD